MEHKLSQNICSYMLRNKIIDSDLADVYIYGLELLLSFIFSTIIILSIGGICNRILNTIVFLVLFIFLRRFTGGYHANTYLMCKVFTIGTYLTVIILSELFNVTSIHFIIISIIGILVIVFWGPIENPNKPLTTEEKNKYKVISLVLFLLVLSGGIIATSHFQPLSNVICYTLSSIIALMILSILKERNCKNEKDNR